MRYDCGGVPAPQTKDRHINARSNNTVVANRSGYADIIHTGRVWRKTPRSHIMQPVSQAGCAGVYVYANAGEGEPIRFENIMAVTL